MKVDSVSQLFEFEIRKANDLPGVPVPAGAVDLAFPTPSFSLGLSRVYGAWVRRQATGRPLRARLDRQF